MVPVRYQIVSANGWSDSSSLRLVSTHCRRATIKIDLEDSISKSLAKGVYKGRALKRRRRSHFRIRGIYPRVRKDLPKGQEHACKSAGAGTKLLQQAPRLPNGTTGCRHGAAVDRLLTLRHETSERVQLRVVCEVAVLCSKELPIESLHRQHKQGAMLTSPVRHLSRRKRALGVTSLVNVEPLEGVYEFLKA